jgi:hypothetical protein
MAARGLTIHAMDSDARPNARTERVSLNALKFQRDDALRTIAKLA